MAKEEIFRWQANFTLVPPLMLDKVQNLPELRIIKENDEPNAKRIEVTTPNLPSFIEALLYAREKCNRCTDFLTLLKGFLVRATLSNITQIGPTGSVGYAPLSLDVIIDGHQDIDLTGEAIAKVIQGNEPKLARQLSHYRRAIETDDIINKIRELYLVVEDDYDKTCQFLKQYAYVRTILSHPELTESRESGSKAKNRFGKTYIDPSSPKDLDELKQDTNELLRKAEEIVRGKLQLGGDR